MKFQDPYFPANNNSLGKKFAERNITWIKFSKNSNINVFSQNST